jgi:hypothetical protein
MCSRLVPCLCVLMLCVVSGTESEIITDSGLRVIYSTVQTIFVTGSLLHTAKLLILCLFLYPLDELLYTDFGIL